VRHRERSRLLDLRCQPAGANKVSTMNAMMSTSPSVTPAMPEGLPAFRRAPRRRLGIPDGLVSVPSRASALAERGIRRTLQ
jgi:hypothetical protein